MKIEHKKVKNNTSSSGVELNTTDDKVSRSSNNNDNLNFIKSTKGYLKKYDRFQNTLNHNDSILK